jgi:hypothetical protein
MGDRERGGEKIKTRKDENIKLLQFLHSDLNKLLKL